MAIINSDLPARSLVHIKEENLQYILPPLEISLTHESTYLTIFANELATPLEAIIGLSSSFIIGLLPKANTQREGFNQACLPAAYINPVSITNPINTAFSLKANRHTYESQQNLLNILDQPALVISAHCYSSHDSTIKLPSIISS